MKIQIIVPTYHEEERDQVNKAYQMYSSPETSINIAFIAQGPPSIESAFDSALAVPEILRLSQQAEVNGMDAIILDCMCDLGLDAVRELVDIPVVGPSQASMSLASILANRFGVIALLSKNDPPRYQNLWRLYDLTGRGVSIRSIDIPVLSLHEDSSLLLEALIKQAILAVAEDDAHALVLGCTGLGGQIAREVQSGLEEAGYNGVPVIDPTGAAIKMAETMVTLGISHSKMTYPSPPKKQVLGYEIHRK